MTEIGTGYFCKIPLSKNNILPSLMINKNIFNECFVNQKQNIITIKTKGTEHQKSLDLNKRKIYQSKIFPLNFIEIYEEIDGIKDFFEIDEIQTNYIKKICLYLMVISTILFKQINFSRSLILANGPEFHQVHQY